MCWQNILKGFLKTNMIQTQKMKMVFDKKIAENIKIAIVRTDYYKALNDKLESACVKTLAEHGVSKNNIKTFSVPGSWEIPLIAQEIAKTSIFDAIITFGIIVKGETYHFEMISNGCSRGLMETMLKYNIPIALEIMSVFDIEHAKARAEDDENNKGIEGAIAVLKTLNVLQKI